MFTDKTSKTHPHPSWISPICLCCRTEGFDTSGSAAHGPGVTRLSAAKREDLNLIAGAPNQRMFTSHLRKKKVIPAKQCHSIFQPKHTWTMSKYLASLAVVFVLVAVKSDALNRLTEVKPSES